MISELPRKTLPAIARAVGLPSDQVLHHCLTLPNWPEAARVVFEATLPHGAIALLLQRLERHQSLLQ